MRERFGSRWAALLIALLLSGVGIGLVEFIDRSQKAFMHNRMLLRAKEELSIIRSELEIAIFNDIFVANGLVALIASKPNFDFSGWELFASSVIRKTHHVELITLAPDDVVKYVYPYEENEHLLDLDYRTLPDQWRTVNQARDIHEILIAGPVNSVHGRRVLIAQVPLFSDPIYYRDYWGVCSLVISLENLFSDVGVESYARKYYLAMRGVDGSGEEGDIFYGTKSTFDDAFATESVKFPYGTWLIAAATKHDLLEFGIWYRVHAARLLGYPLIVLLMLAYGAIYYLYHTANQRALHDSLTSLPNRRYFMYTLERHFGLIAASAKAQSFAILNVDLDKFKWINDTYGHAAGDKVLIAVAKRIKAVLRSCDVVARVGGDEFLVLLTRVKSKEDVDTINNQLQKAICQYPVMYEKNEISIYVSIGVAIYDGQFKEVDEMLKVADENMYDDKRS
ncbi:sensor domain-containing diguanylate cyclase [Vibrio zhanjiangensis]|uniref:Sensor domain-containing diguanylate cyclase n=1 Tax=Vibrio zhanjiangensis TaxID=1046128 RepID=A0ABQ6F0L3_9VIBR|nr:diguanylate cyclase [Vibrio zhanjiangensis]GLT18764.1 sensor domain-containing diguanylate cyclase [Vibrio zhanjiangensis]